MEELIWDAAIIFKLHPESVINVLPIYVFTFVMLNYVISGIRCSPEVYGRINMRHRNNFHPESVINVLRIYVYKFVMFIEIYSIFQNHLPEPVPTQFFRHYELLS